MCSLKACFYALSGKLQRQQRIKAHSLQGGVSKVLTASVKKLYVFLTLASDYINNVQKSPGAEPPVTNRS